MSLMGRNAQFAASGSGRWLNPFVDLLASQPVPPTSNVMFLGTTDSRPKNSQTSGIGARQPSTRKSDLLQPVLGRCSALRLDAR